jgi:succinate dehydrogenase/fumarate reductase flavoprotein subunit
MTRGMAFGFGRYFDADFVELDFSGDRRSGLAKAMISGRVYTVLDQMPEEVRAKIPAIQPNFMLPFDRVGIDPFTQPFEVVLRPEGTIRGTGGLRITSQECQTTVPGLYAAGDAATRELVAGATSGGGAQNSAWALSSGTWAGRGAAAFARAGGPRPDGLLTAIGEAGIRPSGATRSVDTEEVIRAVQGEMHPLEKTFFRSGEALRHSLDILNEQWREVRAHLGGDSNQALPAREAAAMVAVARWCTTSALAREETRGMHQRTDATELDPSLAHRLLVGGLDEIWVRPEAPVAAGSGPR